MCQNNDCFELEEDKCAPGCDDILSTDCIFHNVSSTDQSAKLFNIGITKGASLKLILKKIDERLELLLTTDFSSFNSSNVGENITNIKSFVEAINVKILSLQNKDLSLLNAQNINQENINDLSELYQNLLKINVSSSLLNINTTDEIKVVLQKILTYLENLNQSVSLEFQDSTTVNFIPNENIITADVKLSSDEGNILISRDDGIYATSPSISSLLDAIKTNPDLKILFTELVKSSLPASKFEVMSDSNHIIKYVNSLGEDVSITAKANTLLKLSDVRLINTIPKAGLTITYKGLQ